MVGDSSRPLIPSLSRQQTPPSQAGPGGKMKKSADLISGVLMILVSGPTSYPVASGSSSFLGSR
jgi:hypothetical protein